jgi:hypothetical protein
MAFMVCTITYGLASSRNGTISDILIVEWSWWRQAFRQTMPSSSQRTEVMIFPADGNLRSLCFPGEAVWHLSIDCYLQTATNFPTNSTYHKDDLKQDPHWWPTDISTTIWNLIGGPKFHPCNNLWQEALGFVSLQEINGYGFLCLFVCNC